MEQKEVLIIPTDEIGKKFQEHLEIENNNRILFSGKYGTGKTYFLNDFFKLKNEEYEVFHLYPINYQISQNEDIIKFLKYDILIELFKKDKEKDLKLFEKVEITNFLDYSILTYLFLKDKDNALRSIKTGIELIPELGRPISETIGIFEKYFGFKKQIEAGEELIVKDFLEEIKDKNITETDLISELIKNKINELKGDKKSILILDDLDRIDPEHIFRLLNIFGAHYDNKNHDLPNKFGFDKIILVCDYENIKSIFYHKYGKEADFNGYIDKFFSVEFFDFNKNFIIESYIKLIIKNYIIKFPKLKEELANMDYISGVLFSSILKETSNLKGKYRISLREILKPIKFELESLNKGYEGNIISLINMLIKTLQTIFGGKKDYLLEILDSIKKNNTIKKDYLDDITMSRLNKVYKIFIYHIILEIYYDDNDFNYDNINHLGYNFSLNSNTQSIENIDKNISISEMFYSILIDYINNRLN